MKITSELFEISPTDQISWCDIKTMRMHNDTLAVALSNGRIIEISHLRPSTIDLVFRTYETYLRNHPDMKEK
jgi:hypothetical protein